MTNFIVSCPRFVESAFPWTDDHSLVKQGTKVAETTTIITSFFREITSLESAVAFDSDIICYKGDLPVPRWIDTCQGVLHVPYFGSPEGSY